MTAFIVFHVVVVLALAALTAHTMLNWRALPRLERMPRPPRFPRVSVLIPARNEAAGIERCLSSWLRQDYPRYEVLVYDDESTDDTAARVAAVVAGTANLRLIRGGPLPPGWRGKPHACHRLRAEAQGDLLVFADADVVASPMTLGFTAGTFATLPVDVVSAVPRLTSDSLAVRTLVSLQNWAALTFVPSWLPPTPRRSPLAAVNGQFLAIPATVYDQTGGFGTVSSALAEDSALGRRLQALGYRVRLLDGAAVLTCTPYRQVAECWSANVRNLASVFFGSPGLLLVAMTALVALYLAPPLVLILGLLLGQTGDMRWTWIPLGEVALGTFSRLVADRRAGYSAWVTLLHPVAVACLVAMGVESAARFGLGSAVEWRGRRYRVTDEAA